LTQISLNNLKLRGVECTQKNEERLGGEGNFV
jgi:hypothetical protein